MVKGYFILSIHVNSSHRDVTRSLPLAVLLGL
jgi:hypothetical protein